MSVKSKDRLGYFRLEDAGCCEYSVLNMATKSRYSDDEFIANEILFDVEGDDVKLIFDDFWNAFTGDR